MKNFLLFMASILTLAGCSNDEIPGFGSIYGIVTDAQTNQPVYGATVSLSPGYLSTTTGIDGHFEFVDLEPGQYKIQVQASDYESNSIQIQVNAGGKSIGDISINPVGEISGIKLSTSVLNFDTNHSELTFTIRNIGNSGTVSWYISGINVSWLTISPQEGDTAMGKSSDVKVMIDRNNIASSTSTSFIVNAAGGSQSVSVLVSINDGGGNDDGGNDGGGNDGGGNDGGGNDDGGTDDGGTDGGGNDEVSQPEDYSSATIISCDYRVDAEIVSCKKSGSSVIFTYTLTNNGFGDINDWRIYPPSSLSVIQGGTRSLITDNEGNEYPYPTMTFRSASTTGSNVINTSFPEGIPCKGTVTIKDVPYSIKTITAQIGVYAYPNSTYHMSDSKVTFKNVPVY